MLKAVRVVVCVFIVAWWAVGVVAGVLGGAHPETALIWTEEMPDRY